MARFLLEHRHAAGECASAFAAWLGFDSPLRHHAAASTCVAGGHVVWWHVDAPRPSRRARPAPRLRRRAHRGAPRARRPDPLGRLP